MPIWTSPPAYGFIGTRCLCRQGETVGDLCSHFCTLWTPVPPQRKSYLCPLRPKARKMTQNGGPPFWLEESDPERVRFVMWRTVHAAFPDGQYHLPRSAQLRVSGKSSSCCWWMCTKHRHELCYARKAWVKTLVRPLPWVCACYFLSNPSV